MKHIKEIQKLETNHSWDKEFMTNRSFNERTKFYMNITDKLNEIIDVLNKLNKEE